MATRMELAGASCGAMRVGGSRIGAFMAQEITPVGDDAIVQHDQTACTGNAAVQRQPNSPSKGFSMIGSLGMRRLVGALGAAAVLLVSACGNATATRDPNTIQIGVW